MQFKSALTITLFTFALASNAATFIVSSAMDSGTGTFREAITLANSNGNSAVYDTIEFSASITVGLKSQLPYVGGGRIHVFGNGSILDGGDSIRILNVGFESIYQDLIFRNANTTANPVNGGAAVRCNSNPSDTVVFENCMFLDNDGNQGGAFGIPATGSFIVFKDCLFSSNSANLGGAIFIGSTSPGLLLENVSFQNNTQVDNEIVFVKGSNSKLVLCGNYQATASQIISADSAQNIEVILKPSFCLLPGNELEIIHN